MNLEDIDRSEDSVMTHKV